MPGPSNVYRRGSWGSGYNINILTRITGSFAAEASAIRFLSDLTEWDSGDEMYTYLTTRVYIFKNSPINFTPYSSLRIVVSGTSNNGPNGDSYLRIYIKDLNGSNAVLMSYSGSSSEQTITVNLSNINVSGYVELMLVGYRNNTGIPAGSKRTSYIHEIVLA